MVPMSKLSAALEKEAYHIGDEQDGEAEQGCGNGVDADLAAKDPEADGDRQRACGDLLVARQGAQLLQLLPASHMKAFHIPSLCLTTGCRHQCYCGACATPPGTIHRPLTCQPHAC